MKIPPDKCETGNYGVWLLARTVNDYVTCNIRQFSNLLFCHLRHPMFVPYTYELWCLDLYTMQLEVVLSSGVTRGELLVISRDQLRVRLPHDPSKGWDFWRANACSVKLSGSGMKVKLPKSKKTTK